MATRTQKLKEAGQSLWLDNIQRRELHDGTIRRMIAEDGVCGVTSNPTIFMNSVTKSQDYDEQILSLVQQGKDAEEIYHHITIEDIRNAGNLFLPVFEETKGQDGFVSIELNPQYAFNVEKSIKEAGEILSEIGLPNILIKVPGTSEGISVVRHLISEGLNVNVTLLFSPEPTEISRCTLNPWRLPSIVIACNRRCSERETIQASIGFSLITSSKAFSWAR